MNLLAMCITWNRPELLGRSIHSFLQQTDHNARMLVLDDADQYQSQEHERWALVSVKKRYPTMGVKRNALLAMAKEMWPQLDGFMLWDDDDVYFPHAAASVSQALEEKCWAQPRYALEMNDDGKSLRRVETFNPRDKVSIDRTICYGGCWAWRFDTFDIIGGFPDTDHSEDLKVAFPTLEKFGPSADSSPNINPWYYYNRYNNSISAEGKNFYALRGQQEIEKVDEIPIGWNGPNIFGLPIDRRFSPRPW